jgi:hypothetical protein
MAVWHESKLANRTTGLVDYKEPEANTWRFITFSVITNICNKKSKGTALMELFTATWKLKKFFLTTREVRCVHHGWHGTHRYDIQVLAAVKIIDAPMLTRVWEELEYGIAVCRVIRSAHIEHL